MKKRALTIQGRNIKTVTDALKHQLRKMLAQRVGHFTEVIAETGLSREIINKMHNGTANNPTLESVVRIAESCGYYVTFKKKEKYLAKNKSRTRSPEKAAERRANKDW